MKMGEMPSFAAEGGSDSKDFKKFETPKTRAQQEAEKGAKQMEGGASSDNPSGSASSSASYQDFLDQMLGGAATASAGQTQDDRSVDDLDLPGAFSGEFETRSDSPEEEIERLRQEIASKSELLNADKERVAEKTLGQYALAKSDRVLKPAMILPDKELMKEVLKL